MNQLSGKTALVTGGTSGIGLATAQRLAAEGAHVFITGRRQGGVDDAVASIGDAATGVQGDITDAADLLRLAAAIRERGQGLDVVFANAGGGEFATLQDETPQHLADTLNRNVGGTVFTLQAVLPFLNEGASIVLAGSTAAYAGVPAFGAYAASKAAMLGLTRDWAYAHGRDGVRVNCILPGHVYTPMGDQGGPEIRERRRRAGLLPTEGVAWDIAWPAVFLASDESRWITGVELPVDAGTSSTGSLAMSRLNDRYPD